MYRRICKTVLLTSLSVLTAGPALGQIRADLGPVHIRIVDDAPPRTRYERRTARPNRNAVWINGYWDRHDDEWIWTSGRWQDRDDRRARWIRARYRREGRVWRYEPGHWSHQRLVEGDDYRRWREERQAERDRGRHDRDRRDRDRRDR